LQPVVRATEAVRTANGSSANSFRRNGICVLIIVVLNPPDEEGKLVSSSSTGRLLVWAL
jgi:hypothetical protein